MKKIYTLAFLLSVLTVLPAYALDCADDYIPVCGNDGVTYQNSCYMMDWSEEKGDWVDEIGVAYEGECKNPSDKPTDIACTMEYNPVCGTDGKTYSNKCVAENQNGIDVEHTGECKTQTNVEVEPDTILSLAQKSKLESIVQKVASILSVKSSAIEKETYETLLSVINDKINEMKDFQMRASFTPAGARTYQIKLDMYIYLYYLLQKQYSVTM